METISSRLAQYVIRYNNKEDWYDIYKYCFLLCIETAINLSCNLLIACTFGMVKEFLIFISIFFILRRTCGGLHLTSFRTCFILTNFVVFTTLIVSKVIQYRNITCWLILVCSYTVLLIVSPIENENKKMDAKERNHVVKKMYNIMIIVLILALLFSYLNQIRFLVVLTNTLLVVTISALIGKIKIS